MVPWKFTCVRLLAVPLLLLLLVNGCSRTRYRLQADGEAYGVIGERNSDPRWYNPDPVIDIDPRSRYFDRYDPDCPPMPIDDPASHQYMHCVDGEKGWKHWDDFGLRRDLENPFWKDALREYVDVDESGEVKLDLDTAVRLAYVHSPLNQRQLETVYLSALDVTGERFRLDTQYFGGYDVLYRHDGKLVPASLTFDAASGRYVVAPPFEGIESNRLTVGRPFAGNPAFQVSRRFASAGQLLAGFANSFVFEFTGPNVGLASSLANFTFLQPLLRGAGRDIALEALTQSERTLLGNLRAYAQFRQGLYTQVAIGELGVSGPQRFGQSTNIPVFSGLGFIGGYAGLLQQLQEIRNSDDNLRLQIRTLAQLEALLNVGVIDLVQVDQFRQNVESERSRLLQLRNAFERQLDIYKTDTLGLPPDMPVDLDDGLIAQFRLVPPSATAIQDSIAALQDRVGRLPDDASVEDIQGVIRDAFELTSEVQTEVLSVEEDLRRMEEVAPIREALMTPQELSVFRRDRQQLSSTLRELSYKFEESRGDLAALESRLTIDSRQETSRQMVAWLGNFLRYAQRSVLVRARARLEAVTIDEIELEPNDAFLIALENRLDFMNGRAALVDRWRQIQVQADALQSVLNLTASGDLRTARDNPASFRAPTGSLSAGVEFDAPLTRLLERNGYREVLIDYQRSRRDFIQSRDSLHLGLRTLLRQIEQLRTNLEIQRRAVAIAIRRVDLTRASLYAPVPPPRPGQRVAQFGPTAAFNLLSALSSLRDTQNSFLRVWLGYYAARMRLARELGIMSLDPEGRWIELPLPDSAAGRLNSDDVDQAFDAGQNDLETFDSDDSEETLPDEFENESLPPPIPMPVDNATAAAQFDMTLLPLIPEQPPVANRAVGLGLAKENPSATAQSEPEQAAPQQTDRRTKQSPSDLEADARVYDMIPLPPAEDW